MELICVALDSHLYKIPVNDMEQLLYGDSSHFKRCMLLIENCFGCDLRHSFFDDIRIHLLI